MQTEQLLKNLQHPAGPVDMVLDTDAYNEIDDQFAIAYMMKSPEKLRVKAQPLARAGLVRVTGEAVSLTEEGFLLSNAVIGELLTAFDPVAFPAKTENPIGIL